MLNVTIKYKAGHSYTHPYDKTDLYCLHCGKQGLWCCRDGGDYYVGETYYCMACEHSVNLPGEPRKVEDEYTQVVAHIKAATETSDGGSNAEKP